MSNKPIYLKLYKKDNKFYGLTDFFWERDEWPEEKIIYFAQQLEKYGVTLSFSGYESEHSDHARLNDYKVVKGRHLAAPGVKGIQVRESVGFQYEDFEIDFIFSEPDGDVWDDILNFVNPITPDKVRLVQKNCPLLPEEKEYLECIMQESGLPTDKASVDNEIKNCVGLYEFIQI